MIYAVLAALYSQAMQSELLKTTALISKFQSPTNISASKIHASFNKNQPINKNHQAKKKEQIYSF
jgi:hypothetical protein